jgi:vancomycin aglycone glucosyltransferase
VHLCVPPDFCQWIESLGMPVTTIGPELQKMTAASPAATTPVFTPEQQRQLAEASVAAQFETVAKAAEGCDGAVLNSHRAAIGLEPVEDVRSHIFGERPWLAADPTLAPWPDPADPSVFQTGSWILPDERPLSRELETFLVSGDPPLYFGFASIRAPQGLSQAMIESARAVGRRAVVPRGWADLSLVDDQPDCLAIGEVNQHALFKRIAAIVHHGGAGTTTAAALAGAPQVVIPQMYDQHYWARRIVHLGIGIAHAPGTPTIDSLTGALELAVQTDVAARARSVATAVRRDGVQAAAQRLIGA